MKLVGVISTAVLSLSLGIGIPAYAQQDQQQQEENKDKPAQEQEKDKKAQPEKAVKPEDKNARQEDKNTKPDERNTQEHAQNTKPVQRGRIPDDRFKANFGREHSFRVSETDYRSHRFQYGGYSFGFESAWPSNWLYTQDVYVVEINGVYYLCNASYPGVNLTLSVTL